MISSWSRSRDFNCDRSTRKRGNSGLGAQEGDPVTNLSQKEGVGGVGWEVRQGRRRKGQVKWNTTERIVPGTQRKHAWHRAAVCRHVGVHSSVWGGGGAEENEIGEGTMVMGREDSDFSVILEEQRAWDTDFRSCSACALIYAAVVSSTSRFP